MILFVLSHSVYEGTPMEMKVTSLERTLSKFLRKTVVILYRIVSLKSQHYNWHVNSCWNSNYQFPLSTRSITGFCVSINSIGIKWLCNQLVKVVSCNCASVYCCPYYFSAALSFCSDKLQRGMYS